MNQLSYTASAQLGEPMITLQCRLCKHERAVTQEWLCSAAKALGYEGADPVNWLLTEQRSRFRCDRCNSRQVAAIISSQARPAPIVTDPARSVSRRCKACGAWAVYGDDLCLKCAGN